MKLCARATVCSLPLWGCLIGTDQLGEPDETSGATTASATNPGDDGMTGPSPGDDGSTSGDGGSTTATTTTGASDDSTDADASTGCDIRECTDVPFGDVCDPWLQNCPPGQKCMPYATEGNAWNALMCTPIADEPNAVGEPCTAVGSGLSGIDDCELGAMCFYTDPETLEGTCVAQCTGTEMDPSCAADTTCVIGNEGVFTLCLPSCDPDLDECPAGQMCYAYDEDTAVCLGEFDEPGGYGQDCSAFLCKPGLVCIYAEDHANCDPEATACCTPYCEIDGRPCPDGMSCVLQGETDIGLCMLPQ